MKFSLSILTAFAAAVMAQTRDFDPVTQPLMNQEIPAGKPFEIVWQAPAKYAAGTVALELIGGKDQGSQVPISQIAAGIPNSALKYTWNVDASLGDANVYGIVIRWEEDPKIFQYSNPFHIQKAAGGSSAADTTTTISKSYGEKTITLSHCDCEETSMVTPPAISTPTPTPIATTTYVKPTTIQTKPVQTTVPVPPTQTTGAATVPTGAGARFGASSAALIGAFIVAAFAL